MANGTRLRSLSHSTLSELESMIESLPNKVEIKSINYAPLTSRGANVWICHFCIGEYDNITEPNAESFEKLTTKKQKK